MCREPLVQSAGCHAPIVLRPMVGAMRLGTDASAIRVGRDESATRHVLRYNLQDA